MALRTVNVQLLVLVVAFAAMAVPGQGADCNGNGIEDALDLEPKSFGFEPMPEPALAFRPNAVVISHFDRDGKLDLATVSRDTGVASVLAGRGDCTFLPLRSFPVSESPLALAAADLDGNGISELAIVAPFRLSVLRIALFRRGPLPPPEACGPDPTADGLPPCHQAGC